MKGMYFQYPWSEPCGCDCGEKEGSEPTEGMTKEEVQELIDETVANYVSDSEFRNELLAYLKKVDLIVTLADYPTKEDLRIALQNAPTLTQVKALLDVHAKTVGCYATRTLGHVMPVEKDATMTTPVGVDANGALWTKAYGSHEGQIVETFDRTSAMTQMVGIDDYGRLWTAPAPAPTGQAVNTMVKTTDMTVPVGIDSTGMLWTKPTGGGGSVNLPFYNALDYGITPDNADNTTALQTLLDTVYENGGGTIYLPSGEIKIKSVMVKGRTSMIGAGMMNTCLSCIGTNGMTGVLNMDVNSMGAVLANFSINGNNQSVDGLYWKGQNHEEGRLDLEYYTKNNPAPNEKIKYKSALVIHVMITGCGEWFDSQGHAPKFEHFGVNQELQANYNVCYNNCWIFRNENGFRIVSSDGFITECMIEGNAYRGYYNLGGNWKITDSKIIWNGWSGVYGGSDDCYAVIGKAQSEGNPTGGRSQMVNVELQDNLCKDMYLEGNNHMINALFDNSRYEGAKTGTLTMKGVKHSHLDINFSKYQPTGDKNPTLIVTDSNCEKNIINFIVHPDRCDNVGTVTNTGGVTNVIK